jgi:hypothetical protein
MIRLGMAATGIDVIRIRCASSSGSCKKVLKVKFIFFKYFAKSIYFFPTFKKAETHEHWYPRKLK